MSNAPGKLLSGHRAYIPSQSVRYHHHGRRILVADHVESCAEDIHGAVDNDPGNADSILEPLVAVDGDAVNNRDEAG